MCACPSKSRRCGLGTTSSSISRPLRVWSSRDSECERQIDTCASSGAARLPSRWRRSSTSLRASSMHLASCANI
eukprot:scaffold84322_cov63-Phaeocystis_antarctica.AAC.3